MQTIQDLGGRVPDNDNDEKEDVSMEETNDDKNNKDTADMPPVYESGEDYDTASDAKQQAADCKAAGDWEGALTQYTRAILAAPPSALLYANRAAALLALERYEAAVRDCDLALAQNPDSAKALRVRGKAHKAQGRYAQALADLSASQQIDFDEGTVEDLKFLSELHVQEEKAEAEKRNQEMERLRKRAEEIKKAQEEAKKENQQQQKSRAKAPGGGGGFPGAGMPGMPGMPGGGGLPPGMADIMSDPEILAGMQNPKVMAAFQELMSGPGGPMGILQNPAKMQQLMTDPEVGPFLQKVMSKMGGAMPGAAGGAGNGMPGGPADDGDDIPDMPDISEMD